MFHKILFGLCTCTARFSRIIIISTYLVVKLRELCIYYCALKKTRLCQLQLANDRLSESRVVYLLFTADYLKSFETVTSKFR